jgi:thiamine-phosphate pyrophosphorylase
MADVKPGCRLYLQLPGAATAELEAQLNQAMAKADVACVLLGRDAHAIDEDHAGRLIDLVQTAGAACLIEDDADLAERLGADGVHLAADPESYRKARALLGESVSIGVDCGLGRHQAMLLAELGADYVAFSPSSPSNIDDIDDCAELIAWWAEIFVVPCIGFNIDGTDAAQKLAMLGADFIAPSKLIWQEDDAVNRIAAIGRAISEVRRAA